MLIEELYKENYKIVYGYLFSLSKNETISEDLTSETFLKAFAKISAFKGDSKISTWLCQIAKNEYLQYLRKQKKSEPIEEHTNGAAPDLNSTNKVTAGSDYANRPVRSRTGCGGRI